MSTFHCRIKSGKPGSSTDHSRYIARERKYSLEASESDLVEKWSGNLPPWAKNADQYWKTADKQERVNGAAYRELVIALPNELTPAQRTALVSDITRHLVGSKPFQLAIHDKEASLGGVSQPHAHIMFSDRCCDGIQRPPEQYFRRYNAKRPELGGCKKDSGGKHPSVLSEELKDMRKTVADLINARLEEFGHSSRVDHRSNVVRGIKEEPQRHLGPAKVRRLKQQADAAGHDSAK
jgi:hypothetical protein